MRFFEAFLEVDLDACGSKSGIFTAQFREFKAFGSMHAANGLAGIDGLTETHKRRYR